MKQIITVAAAALLFASTSPVLAEKTAGDHVDDTWLHTKVKAALVGHGSASINIEVYHGVVQLAGFVEDEVHEQAALDAAAGVEGVASVSDQLHIAEPGRSAGRTLDDNTLAIRVKGALADGDAGRGWDINVEVNRGVVLLSGFADSTEERGEAITIAEGVDGVVEVINGMDIKG